MHRSIAYWNPLKLPLLTKKSVKATLILQPQSISMNRLEARQPLLVIIRTHSKAFKAPWQSIGSAFKCKAPKLNHQNYKICLILIFFGYSAALAKCESCEV